MRRAVPLGAVAALAAISSLGTPGRAVAAAPLALGFTDNTFATATGDRWLARAASAGAGWARIDIGWDAPDAARKPAGFDARNPADPHYDFFNADRAIRIAARNGLRVLAVFTGAPRWAEGAGRPAGAQHGSWRPDPKALEDYGFALGTRYSGHFPDPQHPGKFLPRVDAFQPWNEPNLDSYLTPQWVSGRPVAPALYRSMLNGFYAGLKAADPSALVVSAGTAPFGDPEPGGGRIMPALFWRELLCLDPGQRPGAGDCRAPVHFDVLAHHPYSVGNPVNPALNADDVSIPDMHKLISLLRRGERIGSVLPGGRHRVWVTEVSYDSSPPDPGGVPIARHALFLEATLELLWHQGVDTVFWQQVGDQPPVPSYAASIQSGVFYIDGRPKPALTAYEFPLVGVRSRREVWGRSPAGGRVVIEAENAHRWHVVGALTTAAGFTFVVHLRNNSYSALRASVAGRTSLVWPGA